MSGESFEKIANDILDDEEIARKVIQMTHGEGPDVAAMLEKKKWHHCRSANSVFWDMLRCNNFGFEVIDYVFMPLDAMRAPWMMKYKP